MAQPQMRRQLVRLEVEFTSVDINNSFVSHSKSRNKFKIPDVAKQNSLSSKHMRNNTYNDEASSG